MTHLIPSETIEYERYVDGLRRSNAELVSALKSAQEFIDQCAVLMNTGNLSKFEEMFGAGVLASYQQEIQDALAKATGGTS